MSIDFSDSELASLNRWTTQRPVEIDQVKAADLSWAAPSDRHVGK